MTARALCETVSPWWERDDLCYAQGRLYFAGHDVAEMAAKAAGPLYIYSAERVKANIGRVLHALAQTGRSHRLYYAMKANRYAPLLKTLARSRLCGVDICSPNELDHALACGFRPTDISFTGTSVSNRDLDRLLKEPFLTINCDTIGMIRRIGERARGRDIGVRVNPAIGTGYDNNERLTYAGVKTTKFGIYREQWREALTVASAFDLNITSLHFHAGCGYLNAQLSGWEASLRAALSFAADLPAIRTINIGGGLGLPHKSTDASLDLSQWASILRRHFNNLDVTIAVEPGDYIVKDAGMLVLSVTDIEWKTDTQFVYVDGGFNLHPEPVFYNLPCEPIACVRRDRSPADWSNQTIAGNINEAHDLWAESIPMPPLLEGDYIALLNAGGYGASMSSNHCMRGAFKEIIV
ncbi:MAG: diaminopimelate decarboxylase [Pseudomonadota bacterium]